MEYTYLQSMILMAIDCVIFNDKLAGTTSAATRMVLINKYKFYFAQLIYSDHYNDIINDSETIINNIMALDLYKNHKFLILQCKNLWFYDNVHAKY